MKLDKIITTALGASSVANGLPILDNKDHGNELGKIPALENRSGIEHLHDEIHPHKIRHSRDTNKMNQHQHQEHLGEMQDDDPKNPYYAQRPKRADILTSTDEERERQYNRANESLSRIERDYKDMMERFNPSYRILNFNYYKSLQEIKSIANSLKRERSYDEISDRSKTQMNKLADLYDQAKTIYEDGKDNPSYKSPENEHMRERYNNFLPSLEEVEEFVESYRGATVKDHLQQAGLFELKQDNENTGLRGYDKSFQELSLKLNNNSNTLIQEYLHENTLQIIKKQKVAILREFDGTINLMPQVHNLISKTRGELTAITKECEDTHARIQSLQNERKNIKYDIKNERDSIEWFLDHEEISSIQEARNYIKEYDMLTTKQDEKISHNFGQNRQKRDVLPEEKSQKKLTDITTKVKESQSEKPSTVKPKTDIAR